MERTSTSCTEGGSILSTVHLSLHLLADSADTSSNHHELDSHPARLSANINSLRWGRIHSAEMSSSSELEVVGAPVVAVKRSQRRRQPARVRAAPLSPTARPSAPPRKRVDSAREIAAKRGIDGADVLDLDQDAVYELSESSDVEFVNLDPARSADKQVAAGPGHSHAAAPPTSITLSSDSSLVLPPFNSARPKTEPAVPLAGSVSQPAVLSSEGFAGPDVRSSSAPSTTGRPRPRPSPVKPKSRETVASDGSDVDDFFTRKPIVQAKRKPAGRRLPKASQSASTQNSACATMRESREKSG